MKTFKRAQYFLGSNMNQLKERCAIILKLKKINMTHIWLLIKEKLQKLYLKLSLQVSSNKINMLNSISNTIFNSSYEIDSYLVEKIEIN